VSNSAVVCSVWEVEEREVDDGFAIEVLKEVSYLVNKVLLFSQTNSSARRLLSLPWFLAEILVCWSERIDFVV